MSIHSTRSLVCNIIRIVIGADWGDLELQELKRPETSVMGKMMWQLTQQLRQQPEQPLQKTKLETPSTAVMKKEAAGHL